MFADITKLSPLSVAMINRIDCRQQNHRTTIARLISESVENNGVFVKEKKWRANLWEKQLNL